MPLPKQLNVAVLLATHNGARFLWDQIRSLSDNSTIFTLHWLDDHSTDNTLDVVRLSASRNGIALKEWHQTDPLGVPGSYFRLLECVSADIYLFCDQDDIWRPGKIDFTVGSLASDVSTPILAFTDMFLFEDAKPDTLYRVADFSPTGQLATLVGEHRLSLCLPAGLSAQTQGFTRALREIFLRHIPVARDYAAMHDFWMYDIATASGAVRMLHDAPKVLYRHHSSSFCETLFRPARRWPPVVWQRMSRWRALMARHARGLILASETLPRGPALERVLQLAQRIALIDKRQSAIEVMQLVRLKLLPRSAKTLLVNCLFSHAPADQRAAARVARSS